MASLNGSSHEEVEKRTSDPIEQFLSDLSPRLPRKKRLDVMSELRSNLSDRVEELVESGMKEDSAAQQAVSELGDPNNLAAEYGGGRIIIPPTRYHSFKALAVTLVAIHLGASIAATIADIDIAVLILRIPNMRGWQVHEIVTGLATQALADLGFLTLLFWWANLTLPRSLPGLSHPRAAEAKPHWSGLIAPLVFLGVFNVWRNDVFSLYMTGPEGWQAIPMFEPTFVSTFLWPVNLLLLLALGTHTFKVISGPTAGVAATELAYRLAGFTLTGALLGAHHPFALPAGQLATLEPLLSGVFRMALLTALFLNAFAVYRAGARLVNRLT